MSLRIRPDVAFEAWPGTYDGTAVGGSTLSGTVGASSPVRDRAAG
jgi:hypothetical protein